MMSFDSSVIRLVCGGRFVSFVYVIVLGISRLVIDRLVSVLRLICCVCGVGGVLSVVKWFGCCGLVLGWIGVVVMRWLVLWVG